MIADGFRRVRAGHYVHDESGVAVKRRLRVSEGPRGRKVTVDWQVTLPNGESYAKPTMQMARSTAPTWKRPGDWS